MLSRADDGNGGDSIEDGDDGHAISSSDPHSNVALAAQMGIDFSQLTPVQEKIAKGKTSGIRLDIEPRFYDYNAEEDRFT